MTDKARGSKVTLADYSLTPDVAIVDPQFVMSMPKSLTVDTGIDCLTHALEAGSFDLCFALHRLQRHAGHPAGVQVSARWLIENPGDEEARTMMHNAACIAAIAFSNASVGVNHAMAHAFGARFGVSHGRANALMLPHVIAYNAGVPTKFMPSPNQRAYVAHKKYAMIADLLGLGGHTVEEKVAKLVTATEQLLERLRNPALDRGPGYFQRGIRTRHARPRQSRLRRSLLALESSHAAGERTRRALLDGFPRPRDGRRGCGCRTAYR